MRTVEVLIGPRPVCPVCGSPTRLLEPHPHQTWKPFWSCQNYPMCTGTKQVTIKDDAQLGFWEGAGEYKKVTVYD